VRAVAAALDLRRVVLVGNSLGGAVALDAARLLRGRTIGVVGVDTLHDLSLAIDPAWARARAEAFRSDYAGTCHAMVEALFHPGAYLELRAWAEKEMCVVSVDVVAGMMEGSAASTWRRRRAPPVCRFARSTATSGPPTSKPIGRSYPVSTPWSCRTPATTRCSSGPRSSTATSWQWSPASSRRPGDARALITVRSAARECGSSVPGLRSTTGAHPEPGGTNAAAIDWSKLTARDVLDIAAYVECEAQERYELFATHLDRRGDSEAARFFRLMAELEGAHGAQVSARRHVRFADLPGSVRDAVEWDVEGPPLDREVATLTTARAFELALASEERARDFFAEACQHLADEATVAVLAELHRDEISHLHMLHEMRKSLRCQARIWCISAPTGPVSRRRGRPAAAVTQRHRKRPVLRRHGRQDRVGSEVLHHQLDIGRSISRTRGAEARCG